MTQADHKMVLYLELKVTDSVIYNIGEALRFKYLRYLYADKIFDLDVATML